MVLIILIGLNTDIDYSNQIIQLNLIRGHQHIVDRTGTATKYFFPYLIFIRPFSLHVKFFIIFIDTDFTFLDFEFILA